MYTKDKMLEEIKDQLVNKIIPFWDRLYDPVHGGFYGGVDMDGNIIVFSDKGSVYISRILWSYSHYYNYSRDKEKLNYATYAFNFLKNKLYDYKNKGIYWSVLYNGAPIGSDKHLYAQAFAVYGLSEYYQATKDQEALNLALEMGDILVSNILDFPNNYHEQYTKDWKPVSNTYLKEYEIVAEITSNTLLHIAEALANLYKMTKSDKYLNATKTVIDILFSKAYDPNNKSLLPFIDQKSEEIISYGHNIEVSWLFDEILTIIDARSREYDEICMDLGTAVFDKAYDGNVIYNYYYNGDIDKNRIWWVQAEGMVGFLNLYQKTKDEKYLTAVENIFQYILDYFVTNKGEWYWSVEETNNPTEKQILAGLWKANYHNVRSLIQLLTREK